jgi:outer membrane protein TolC
VWAGRVCALAVLAVPVAAGAQTPSPGTHGPGAPALAGPASLVLTLDEALVLAEARSEQVAISAAGVERARGGQLRARSERMPQLFGSASYDRALASEFEGLFDDGFFGDGSGDNLDLPFGRKDTYRLNLGFSQALYAGGRIKAQEEQARLASASAATSLGSTRAQLALDVSRAYFEAALTDRFVAIAEASYEQANRAFEQTRAQREAGRQSEFDLLRAQVERDTIEPNVIRQRANREIAYLQLKQLLEIPAATDLRLALDLEADGAVAERLAGAIAAAEAGLDTRARSGVALAGNAVAASEAGVRIARSQRLPAVSLVSSYGLVNYSGLPAFDDFRDNWTLGAVMQVPIFTGGRIKGDEIAARADLEEARQLEKLSRELADLDAESARQELIAARAAWDASGGTIRQAARAYEIAELRYKEGLSTQLELSDARLLLQQARTNRAVAGRDLQLARIRLALLPDLPLTTPGAAGAAAAGQRISTALSATGTFRQTTGAAASAAASGASQR